MNHLKDLPHRIIQTGVHVDPALVANQLHLNGRLGNSIVKHFFKTAREYVVSIGKSDFGVEAAITSEDGKVRMPGFFVASSPEDLTVERELGRASRYVLERLLSTLKYVCTQPFTYQIASISRVRLGDANPHTGFRAGMIDVVLKSHGLDVKTESEYWQTHVVPRLTDPYERGRAVKALAEARKHHLNTLSLPFPLIQPNERIMREQISQTLYCLLEMMTHHALTPQRGVFAYKAQDGEYVLNDSLEFSIFYNPELCEQVFGGKTCITVSMERAVKVK